MGKSMAKASWEDMEFEKNRQELLKNTQKSLHKEKARKHDDRQGQMVRKTESGGDRKYAWEYEIEAYRKNKAKERFHSFGAICGIVALLLTVTLNFDTLIFIAGKLIGK